MKRPESVGCSTPPVRSTLSGVCLYIDSSNTELHAERLCRFARTSIARPSNDLNLEVTDDFGFSHAG